MQVTKQLTMIFVDGHVFFKVAEVTTKNHCRLSINGWFHTKTPPVFQTPFYAAPPGGLFGNQRLGPKELDLDLESWIKPDYLDAKNIVYMQKYIEDNSEISLHGYFKREAFEGVLESLKYQGKQQFVLKKNLILRLCYRSNLETDRTSESPQLRNNRQHTRPTTNPIKIPSPISVTPNVRPVTQLHGPRSGNTAMGIATLETRLLLSNTGYIYLSFVYFCSPNFAALDRL